MRVEAPARWVRDGYASSAVDCAFDALTHTYTIGGIVVPSVTSVLREERLTRFEDAPAAARTLAERRAEGVYVHQVLHAILDNDFDFPDDCEPELRGYVQSALVYLEDARTRVVAVDGATVGVEMRFWHVGRMFAGCCDFLGFDRDDVLTLSDFKTGNPEEVSAALQLAAYEVGVRECFLPEVLPDYRGPIRRRTIKLFRDGAPARADLYTDPRDVQMFFCALSCVHFRRNALEHR